MTETSGRPHRLPAAAVPINREASCLGLVVLSPSAPFFLPDRLLPVVANTGVTSPKCDDHVAAVESIEAPVGRTAPTAIVPLRHPPRCLVSASPCRPMMSLTRSRQHRLALGWLPALTALQPVHAERRLREAPPGIEPVLSPVGDGDCAENIDRKMTHRILQAGGALASSSNRSACLAARKARDEKSNADERPPAGGEPDRHR